MKRLSEPDPVVTIELRPPPSGLSYSESMDTWIDMYHSLQRLARADLHVFLTDNAVGASEEESLNHLAANLADDVHRGRIVPFLTCKHTLDYCLMFARRAAAHGFQALTVLGGDDTVGPPRCVPHSKALRALIRKEAPGLALGGWANPHRPAEEQAGYIATDDFEADFYLTQVVSHHSIGGVEALLEESGRRGLDAPGVFGVFYYRSANPKTLETLGKFFPVPADALTREFEAGASADEICARTVVALRRAGAKNIYLSNLGFRRVESRYRRIMEAVKRLEG